MQTMVKTELNQLIKLAEAQIKTARRHHEIPGDQEIWEAIDNIFVLLKKISEEIEHMSSDLPLK